VVRPFCVIGWEGWGVRSEEWGVKRKRKRTRRRRDGIGKYDAQSRFIHSTLYQTHTWALCSNPDPDPDPDGMAWIRERAREVATLLPIFQPLPSRPISATRTNEEYDLRVPFVCQDADDVLMSSQHRNMGKWGVRVRSEEWGGNGERRKARGLCGLIGSWS